MAKGLTQPAKGTRDFLPEELRKRSYVTGIIREVYESHGFQPLETPSFERLDTLLGKYGDEGDQLVFKILHRGEPLVKGIRAASAFVAQEQNIVRGRSGETAPGAERLLSDLGLRYDLTVPLARVYAEYLGKQIPNVWKRYQMQPVWRADNPSKGRFREFWQCDVDVVGSESRVVEAEVIGAVAECLSRLGFADFEIRLNHRGLLTALCEVSGVPAALYADAIVAIDKLDKVPAEVVGQELEAKGVPAAARSRLLELVSSAGSLDRLEAEMRGHEAGLSAIQDLRQVLAFSAETPAKDRLVFDLSLARGLGYYTGAIFEIRVPDLAGSLGGGGRYDGLIGMFLGKQVPACGFSIGLERILVVMEERRMYPAHLAAGAEVMVGFMVEAEAARGLRVARELRRAGFSVELRPAAMKPDKLRKTAFEAGCHAVVSLALGGSPELKTFAERWTEAARREALEQLLRDPKLGAPYIDPAGKPV